MSTDAPGLLSFLMWLMVLMSIGLLVLMAMVAQQARNVAVRAKSLRRAIMPQLQNVAAAVRGLAATSRTLGVDVQPPMASMRTGVVKLRDRFRQSLTLWKGSRRSGTEGGSR